MKTILLLDDEAVVLRFLRIILTEYKLIEATTAEQALRVFLGRGGQIDLLLADLTLPTSSGIQVALLLRSEIPDLPVILTSGYSVGDWSDRHLGDLERLGSNSVVILQKPFLAQVLSNAVYNLIGSVTEVVRTA